MKCDICLKERSELFKIKFDDEVLVVCESCLEEDDIVLDVVGHI